MSEAPSPASAGGATSTASERALAAASDAGADLMPEATAAAAGMAAPQDAGFGRVLAAAREAQGVPAAEMAGRLRLHPRQLEALEQERLDELPSAPFVRGYVRSYAKELKIDPAPLLAALGTRLPAPATIGLNAPAGLMMTEVRRAGVERASRMMVIGGTLVALFTLAIVGWIASTRLKPAAVPPQVPQAAAPQEAPAAAAPVTDPGSGTATGAPGTGESPVAAVAQPGTPPPVAPAAESAAATTVATTAATTAPTTAATTAVPAPTVGAPAAASTMASGLRLQVSGKPSWIEVTDADGRVVFVGTLSSGAEQYLANLKPPLRLTIGNASTVTVTYRGKLVDLQPHIRANDLARLTLE